MGIIFTSADRKRLEALGVQAVYLFGSRAVGRATPLSDFDFAILMPEANHRRGDVFYDQFYDLLSPYCDRTLQNDVIDIVYLRDVSLELQMHVIRHGRLLFDADPSARADFEARTMVMYSDYQPVLDEFDTSILQRYATH